MFSLIYASINGWVNNDEAGLYRDGRGASLFWDANCQPNPGLESLILTQPRIDLRERITRINMVNFASLNVRGIQSDLEKKNLARDLKNYEIDIAAIQETHLKEENGHTTIIGNKKNYDLFYVSNGNNAYHGVGIAVSSNLRCRFQRISDRICKITSDNTEDGKQNKTYKENKPKLVFIAAYSPTLPACIKNEEETDKFYEDHEKATEEIPKRDILVIAVDFNAECGSARERSHPTLGRYGKGVMNENGERLVDFGRWNELFVTNTFFYHKMSHRTTWEMAEQHDQHMDAATKTKRRNRYSNQIRLFPRPIWHIICNGVSGGIGEGTSLQSNWLHYDENSTQETSQERKITWKPSIKNRP